MTAFRLLFLACLFALATTGMGLCGASTGEARARLSEDWAFHLGEALGAENPVFDDSKWRRLNVPHDFLNRKLTGSLRMEFGDASGMALMDGHSRTWRLKACDAIDARVAL